MSYKSTSGYFVPQAGVDNDRVFSYGYVVSESYPYFPTTRMPLDFVNLYKYGPGSTGYTYKPTAYSIPLGLVFKLLVGQGNNWTLDDLLPADLQDALADELKTSSGINIPMDKDSGAPAALVPGQIK